jgi:restriction system protein
MTPRKFEELVADMFRNQGYEVTLTPSSNDGGMDVIAVRRDGIGTVMIVVECKRYAEDNKVGVEIARGLYGVVEQRRATRGIIATTSFFTKGC